LLALSQAAAETHVLTSVVRSDARSGRLVRSLMVASRPVPEQVIAPRVIGATLPRNPRTEPVNLNEAVERVAAETQLSAWLIHSVIQVESNYNPLAVSPKGALGLMQLVPSTARRFGVSNVFNPVENLQGGARYLRYLLELFHNNYPLALAAYNAGEGAVARYGGVPPYAETQSYIFRVQKRLEAGKKADDAQKAKVGPAEEPAYKPIHRVIGQDGKEYFMSR
jgi:hypothetical protein